MLSLTLRSLSAVLSGTLLTMFLISLPKDARAQGVGAVVPLPADMRTAAEKYLPGVVGEAVPAFTIDASLTALVPGTRTYTVVSGTTRKTTEQHQLTASEKAGVWRYTVERNGCAVGDGGIA